MQSYTGVALVLALMQVREIVKKNGGNTGPIIMLSYKNHALDEFLVDVIKSSGDLGGRRSSLIRLGNPENFALKDYTEKRSAAESESQRRLDSALGKVKASFQMARRLNLGHSAVDFDTFAKLLCLCLEQEEREVAGDIDAENAYGLLKHFLTDAAGEVGFILEESLPLFSSVNHWSKSCKELYGLWMTGSVPPPRCAKLVGVIGRMNQCTGCAEPQSNYCAVHCCQVEHCEKEREHNDFYCHQHKCNAEQCQAAKLMPSQFCADHTCILCLDNCTRQGLATCFDHTCRVDQCNRPQLFPLQVCLEHKCMLCPAVVANNYIRDMQLGFCEEHKCDYEACQLSKAFNLTRNEMTRYCENHTCFKCVENGGNLNAETIPHRFVCADHVLCEYINELGDECCNLVMGKDEFHCEEHAALMNKDDVTCYGVTRQGKKCKARKPRDIPFQHPWFCGPHENQRPISNNRAEPSGKSQFIDPAVSLVSLYGYSVDRQPVPSKCCFEGCIVRTCHGSGWMCPFHSELQLWEQKASISKAADSATLDSLPAKASSNQEPIMEDPVNAVEEYLDYDFASDEDEAVVLAAAKHISDNPDEMDADSMEGKSNDEEDDNIDYENNQERHELYQSESDSDTEASGVNGGNERDRKAPPEDIFKQLLDNADNWHWEMTQEQRVSEIDDFLVLLADLLEFLVRRAEPFLDNLRRERAEANSAVLKQATLIGGTVVGAAKRLMALRAAEPFAVIVEEACEVMEPTLIAVLAVDSVQKMELIGDHRQLPAFINHNWYNFEITVPKIKKSLFERLIDCSEKSKGATSICTVLDVQRRMRSYISDITRHHYSDKVVIQDHEKTSTQRIGDRLEKDEKKNFSHCLSNWTHKGMDVPGIVNNLFFWNLKNNGESKPVAGLSACNETEALAVASLTRYLQFCGVPDSSISIITPYQGQRRMLIKTLRNVGCMAKPNYSNTSHSTETSKLTVSTVDRYQGDENDIVILSLVRTKPGNRFVSLVNRFIVATSRARIGFYVIGSVGAVSHGAKEVSRQDLKHWDSFLDMMASSDASDSLVSEVLPICCPIHADTIGGVPSTSVASMKFPSAAPEWKSFCSVPCSIKLPCGHECGLPCHMFAHADHNRKCMVMLPRNCSVHNQPVPCHEITGNKNWKCDIVDTQQSPFCAHSFSLKCFEFELMESELMKWPRCVAKVPDFIHPACNHPFTKLTCDVRRQYDSNPPNCKLKVTKVRDCGHQLELECFQTSKPLRPCREPVNGEKPRCGHQISFPCHEYKQLQSSYDSCGSCEPAYDTKRGRVIIDQTDSSYGPEENTLAGFGHLLSCTVPTLIRRSCSHMIEMPCAKAFAAVRQHAIADCNEIVEVLCALCFSSLLIPCSMKDKYESLRRNVLEFRGMLSESTLLGLKDQLKPILSLLLDFKCNKNIKIQRSCTHELELSCVELVKFVMGKRALPLCKQSIRQSRECGHTVERKCHQRHEVLSGNCLVVVNEVFAFPNCGHELVVKECHDLQRLRNDPVPKCQTVVPTNHLRCGHATEVCCNVMPLCRICDDTYSDRCLRNTDNIVDVTHLYCQPMPDTPVCVSGVNVKLSCSHILTQVPCHEAFSWTLCGGGEEPLCSEFVDWNSPLCCHELPVMCRDKSTLELWDPWRGVIIAKEVISKTENYDQYVYRVPLAIHPEVPASISNILPKCRKSVGVMFDDCKHITDKQCSAFFANLSVICEEQVCVTCQNPACRQERTIPCGKFKHMSADEIARDCPFIISKTCGICAVNKVNAPCGQVLVECNRRVNVTLPCGHQAEWLCSEYVTHPAAYHDDKTGLNRKCKECAYSVWEHWRNIDILEDQLRDIVKEKLLAVVKDSTIIREDLITVRMDQYEKARTLNIGRLQNRLLAEPRQYVEEEDVPWPKADNQDDVMGFIRNHYDLSFLSIFRDNVSHDTIKENRLRKGITGFGQGVQIQALTEKSLEVLFLGSNESKKRLCICLAFACHRLAGIRPFIPLELANELRVLDHGKLSKDQRMRLRQLNDQVTTHQAKGFDCVKVSADDVPVEETVFWHHHAVVPLCVQVIEMKNSCLVCLERKPRSSALGAICKQGHFVCWESCFSDYVNEAKGADSQASYVSAHGSLCCPQCKSEYDISKVASQAPGEIGNQLIALKCQLISNKESQKAREDERRIFEEEQRKIKAMKDGKERELYFLRKEICEEILTNRCPRCRRAFADFDGCFALTCSGQGGCDCQFCAWCFATTIGDIHGHVARCPRGNGDVFGNRNLLVRVWNDQRRTKINTLLQNKSPEIRRELLKIMERDFKDIGLVM